MRQQPSAQLGIVTAILATIKVKRALINHYSIFGWETERRQIRINDSIQRVPR